MSNNVMTRPMRSDVLSESEVIGPLAEDDFALFDGLDDDRILQMSNQGWQ